MVKEKSCGAVIYKQEENECCFFLTSYEAAAGGHGGALDHRRWRKKDLIAPLWSGDKKRVLNYLH